MARGERVHFSFGVICIMQRAEIHKGKTCRAVCRATGAVATDRAGGRVPTRRNHAPAPNASGATCSETAARKASPSNQKNF